MVEHFGQLAWPTISDGQRAKRPTDERIAPPPLTKPSPLSSSRPRAPPRVGRIGLIGPQFPVQFSPRGELGTHVGTPPASRRPLRINPGFGRFNAILSFWLFGSAITNLCLGERTASHQTSNYAPRLKRSMSPLLTRVFTASISDTASSNAK